MDSNLSSVSDCLGDFGQVLPSLSLSFLNCTMCESGSGVGKGVNIRALLVLMSRAPGPRQCPPPTAPPHLPPGCFRRLREEGRKEGRRRLLGTGAQLSPALPPPRPALGCPLFSAGAVWAGLQSLTEQFIVNLLLSV